MSPLVLGIPPDSVAQSILTMPYCEGPIPFGRMRPRLVQRGGEGDRETLFWDGPPTTLPTSPWYSAHDAPATLPMWLRGKQAILLRVILFTV